MDYQPITPPPAMEAPSSAPVTPVPSGPFSSGGSPRRSMLPILAVVFGVAAFAFGAIAIGLLAEVASSNSRAASQTATAVAAAKKQQLADDTQAQTVADESPFRSYTAPESDGSFVINFPKDWSAAIDTETNGTNVSLTLNPDFIATQSNQAQLVAARVFLIEDSYTYFLNQFQGYINNGKLQETNVTVSGISGYNLTGTFADGKTTREVVVPVRDKVLVFTNEDSRYATEFNEILAQAHINP